MKKKRGYIAIIFLAIGFIITTVCIVIKTNLIRDEVEFCVGSVGASSFIASKSSLLCDSLETMQEAALKNALFRLQAKDTVLYAYPELSHISASLNGLAAYVSGSAIDRLGLRNALIRIRHDGEEATSMGRRELGGLSAQLSDYWTYTHILVAVACLLMILLCYLSLSILKTKDSLKRSNERFSRIFNYNPAAIVVSRLADQKLTAVNDSFLHLFGFSKADDVYGRKAGDLDLFTPVPADEGQHAVRQREQEIKTMQGTVKWVSASALFIELDGSPCLLTVLIDITEAKKAVEELSAVNKELEAFSYSVAHDLRSPLRAMNGYAQILGEDYGPSLDEDGKRMVAAIRSNASRMGTLIDDLLKFSRLGRKELQKRRIDMNALTQSVLHEVAKATPHQAHILIGNLNDVDGDYTLLSQALFNLISNAVKYSSKKEAPVVEISSEEKDGELVFSVKDNGAGFDMRYADKLFTVFQRLHMQREFEGTGVGLAIVHRIISKHGGRVYADAKVEEGATFYFTLPEKPTNNA